MFNALKGWGIYVVSYFFAKTKSGNTHADDNAEKGWTSMSKIISVYCDAKYCDHDFFAQLDSVLVNKYTVLYSVFL